jgi:hypothetical protein
MPMLFTKIVGVLENTNTFYYDIYLVAKQLAQNN